MTKKSDLDRIWIALCVTRVATPALCKMMVKKYGTQRAAADAVHVSTVHFCRMMKRKAKASHELMEAMCYLIRKERA